MKRAMAVVLALFVYTGVSDAVNATRSSSALAAAPGLCDVFPYLPGCR